MNTQVPMTDLSFSEPLTGRKIGPLHSMTPYGFVYSFSAVKSRSNNHALHTVASMLGTGHDGRYLRLFRVLEDRLCILQQGNCVDKTGGAGERCNHGIRRADSSS